MMKSKSSSRRRDRSPDDSKSKRAKPRSKSREREKVKGDTKPAPRKTRWQPEEEKHSSKNAPLPEAVANREKSKPPPRVKDFLHDKEKIVDLLFQTVTGAALQELIPDYLKKRSTDELKKLCLEQIKTMSDDVILQIISGKVDSSNKEEKLVEKEKILKPEQPSSPEKKEKEVPPPEKKLEEPDVENMNTADSASQLQNEINSTVEKTISEEENEIPLVIKDEVAKDLILPERDAELLELEMRARAIRSLLKAKCQSANEEDNIPKKDD